ncbi:MAG: hypothetical protein HQ509_05325 [Candidatus Marinimicrobia bacterium]|nr:hypothetical protein [Candidatus Neomarinimicrobiota bacterium]
MKIFFVSIFALSIFIISCGNLNSQVDTISNQEKKVVKVWTPLLTFEGKGELKSQLMPILSDSIKVECQYSGHQNDTFIVYLLEQGKSIQKDGGFPLVMERGKGQKELSFSPKPGEYYLHILSQNSNWDLKLYEQRQN